MAEPYYEILPQSVLIDRAKKMRARPTRAEARLWAILRKKKLGVRVYRQRPFAGYILDFYIPKWKLAIEVDGSSHKGREEYDNIRSDVIRLCGLSILRVTNEQVLRRPRETFDLIKSAAMPS